MEDQCYICNKYIDIEHSEPLKFRVNLVLHPTCYEKTKDKCVLCGQLKEKRCKDTYNCTKYSCMSFMWIGSVAFVLTMIGFIVYIFLS